jgi:hypothetical protein
MAARAKSDIDVRFGELSGYVEELAEKFVNRFLPADPATSPDAYALDVRAYCMLAHAAFEEFIEAVASEVVERVANGWLLHRTVSDVLLTLLSWHGSTLKIDENEGSVETKNFDYLRPLINAAKAAFSNEIHNNHGISIIHLRNLLTPIAIDIKQDAGLLNSLKQLAEGRGLYAHHGKVKSVLAPEYAKNYVEDCLSLCDDIKTKAIAKLVAAKPKVRKTKKKAKLP